MSSIKQHLDVIAGAFDRLAGGEPFNVVVEQTGASHAISAARALMTGRKDSIAAFKLLHSGSNQRGYTADVARCGDPGIYDEIRVGVYQEDLCVADVLIGITETNEPRVLCTTGGNGDDGKQLAVFPLRPDGQPSWLDDEPSLDSGVEGATEFMRELLDSVETLAGIAEQQGPRTLADLMYLQNAILTGGFIDAYPDESSVLGIVRSLPSAARWMQYIKVEYLAQPG